MIKSSAIKAYCSNKIVCICWISWIHADVSERGREKMKVKE